MSAHGPAYRAGLERFRRGIASRAESKEVVRHLLAGCRECQRVASRIWLQNDEFDEARTSTSRGARESRDSGYDYSGVFARVEQELCHHQVMVAEEASTVPSLRQELTRHPKPRQEVLAANSARFQTWSLVESLLDDCRRMSQSDPTEAEHLARLAIRLAEQLDAGRYGDRRVYDLQARACAELGNLLRMQERYREAEKGFDQARELLRLGTGDPVERAALLSLEASMWSSQRRYDRAMALVDRTIAMARRLGQSELLTRALIQKAKFNADRGLAEDALGLLLEAQRHLEGATDLRLTVMVQHNILYALVQSGRFEEAAAGLADTRVLYRRLDHPLDQIRLTWLEGRILHGLGQVEDAESCFRTSLDRMLEEGLDYDAAMVGLDLAVLYSEQNRSAEMQELVAAMLPVFRSHRIHREAIAALLIFREAAARECVSAELAREIAEYLHRSQLEPNLRFQTSHPS